MKYTLIFAAFLLAMSCAPKQPAVEDVITSTPETLRGAWEMVQNNHNFLMIADEHYLMLTEYDLNGKQFFRTFGGPYTLSPGKLTTQVQFNSADSTSVGRTLVFDILGNSELMQTNASGIKTEWTRIDDGTQNIAGNWRFYQMGREGTPRETIGARRTLKLLSGTKFQWAAINIETGVFSGTGGGSYTFKDGIYTEHIEFFSRDNNRVGMSLSFNDTLRNNLWIHSGKTSAGAPMYEIWSKMDEGDHRR